MRECARRAGVSHAAPGYYFKSLDDLTIEVADDGYLRMVACIIWSQNDKSSLIGVGFGYIDFALRHPQHFRLMQNLEFGRGMSTRLQNASGAAMTCLRDALHSAWTLKNGIEPAPELLHQRV